MRQPFRAALNSFGAHVLECLPHEHDSTVAFTSHLPQLISTALAATLSIGEDNAKLTQIFGPGLLGMTRLALSSPELGESFSPHQSLPCIRSTRFIIGSCANCRGTLGERKISHTFEEAARVRCARS